MSKHIQIAIALAATLLATSAQAAFTISNTNGGNGFVTPGPAPYAFTLTGSDNGPSGNLALYGTVAATAGTLSGSFLYTTFDRDGSDFDPAGYFVNATFTQLSAPALPTGGSNSGTFSFSYSAGDNYGFYVNSTDGVLGSGTLSVGGIPEPATWALMIGGFGMTGFAMRRRNFALNA